MNVKTELERIAEEAAEAERARIAETIRAAGDEVLESVLDGDSPAQDGSTMSKAKRVQASKGWVTRSEAARQLGVPQATLRRAERHGLKTRKRGRNVVVDLAAAERAVRELA